jgi:thiol:disulfide interchange protein DsbD
MFNAVNIPGISLWKREYSQFSGGYWYVFSFGIISSLTISPCVFPALGVILTIAAQKKNLLLGSGLLFSFSLGMGLFFVLLGILGSRWLPKSGRWMNIAKKIMGIVFLLMAEYFIIKAGRLL